MKAATPTDSEIILLNSEATKIFKVLYYTCYSKICSPLTNVNATLHPSKLRATFVIVTFFQDAEKRNVCNHLVRDVTWMSANGLHLRKWTVALIQVTLSHLNKC